MLLPKPCQRRRPKACRRAKSRGREGIAGEREQANLYQMVGGQRAPLPQGSVSVSERERQREREGERQREKERRGRESDRESESQEEGGKKEESLYLMVGGQRAWT